MINESEIENNIIIFFTFRNNINNNLKLLLYITKNNISIFIYNANHATKK